MKPITIALTNNKGGIGKTSSVLGPASGLMRLMPDAKILLVDSDEQSCLKTSFKIKTGSLEGGLYSVLTNGIEPENMVTNVRPNLDVIMSGGRFMRDFERYCSKLPHADTVIADCFKSVTKYDVIIFDTPPALSILTSNVYTYCDYIVIPCTLDLFAYVGVKNTITFIDNLREHFSGTQIKLAKILGVLPTMYDARRNMDVDTLQDIENYVYEKKEIKDVGARVFTEIRQDIKVKSSQIKRQLVHEFAPTSKASEDYLKFAQEVLEAINGTNVK